MESFWELAKVAQLVVEGREQTQAAQLQCIHAH